ncbi:MFS transporter [Sulfodiicoccus acidiphilus]|uniref:MFS transporter n=1 Tax=Sulfodiicoccus acidiphilus TaxID=1670455 RepID=A0A348B4P1_9CREN|nr:MFS transporter [Sulfodiicoccus acidiphilus]BBD73143.1 MFS transporter [Sulfodiicoccus acidiphilus]GGU00508.1 MFS transporter [Sulfodiicoccus acidiphilus]
MGYFDDFPSSTKVRTFFVSSAGFLLDGYDLSVISFASTFILREFSLTTPEYGLLLAASLIGMIPGSVLFGWLSDRMGRSKLMGVDLFFFLVFGITAALSQNFAELFASRLLLGVGIGGDYPISSTLMSEMSPPSSRGRYLVGAVSMYWIGSALSGAVTYPALTLGPFFWRYVFLVGALLSVPIILLRLRLSESPRWLVSTGALKGSNLPTPELENKGAKGFADLFKGRMLWVTVFLSSVWFLFDVASYGIGLYYPYLLEQFAFPSKYEVVLGTLAISAGAIVGYAVAEAVVDSLGRRVVLLTGLGSMAALLYLGWGVRLHGPLLVPYFMSFVAMEQWAGAVTLFYPTELFPTSVRSSGQGVATAASRVGAVLGVFYFPQLTVSLGLANSLFTFATVSLVALAISLLGARETAKKQLEDTSQGVR